MTRRMIRHSALAVAVMALVLGTLQVLVSPAAGEASVTVAHVADYADAPGPHLTEVVEGRYAWIPDAQHIATLEAQGATVVPVAHQSLATADGVDALAGTGTSHLFLGESFYRGFLSDDLVAALEATGLDVVTVRAATFAFMAPGVAEAQESMDLKMIDAAGEAVAVGGAVDALATRDGGGVVVGSAIVGGRCVSLFGVPWGATAPQAGALLGAFLGCGAMPEDAPVEETPDDGIADDGLVDLPPIVVT